jgi:hypothetical protein
MEIHKGQLDITSEGIAVSDEVASELQQEFGASVEISDIITESAEEPIPEE